MPTEPVPIQINHTRTIAFPLPLTWPLSEPLLITHVPDVYTFLVQPDGRLCALAFNKPANRIDKFVSQQIAFTTLESAPLDQYQEALVQFELMLNWERRSADFKVNGTPLIHQHRSPPLTHIALTTYTLKQPDIYAFLTEGMLRQMPLWRDRLFLYTLQELETRVQRRTEYDIIKASGLLRLLIGEPESSEALAVLVASGYGHTLSFEVAELSELSIPLLLANRYPTVPTVVLTLADFLAHPVLQQDEGNSTIHHLIKMLAEVKGGVHFGLPKTRKADKERVMEYDARFQAEHSVSVTQLWQVAQLTLQACAPLMRTILQAPAKGESATAAS